MSIGTASSGKVARVRANFRVLLITPRGASAGVPLFELCASRGLLQPQSRLLLLVESSSSFGGGDASDSNSDSDQRTRFMVGEIGMTALKVMMDRCACQR
jgi:hypothetical protein